METSQNNTTKQENKAKRSPKQDGRGNHLAHKTPRGEGQVFILPKGRAESNCKKITLMVRPSVYERCKEISDGHIAQLIRDAIDLYLINSLDNDKNLRSDKEQ